MDQTVDQIEQRIERSRQGLRSNLNELGDRMKSAIDWRETFRRNPAATFAVAFIGGVLLASAVGRAEASQRQRRVSRHIAFNRVRSGSQQRALRAWDEIKTALVGMENEAVLVPNFHRRPNDQSRPSALSGKTYESDDHRTQI